MLDTQRLPGSHAPKFIGSKVQAPRIQGSHAQRSHVPRLSDSHSPRFKSRFRLRGTSGTKLSFGFRLSSCSRLSFGNGLSFGNENSRYEVHMLVSSRLPGSYLQGSSLRDSQAPNSEARKLPFSMFPVSFVQCYLIIVRNSIILK